MPRSAALVGAGVAAGIVVFPFMPVHIRFRCIAGDVADPAASRSGYQMSWCAILIRARMPARIIIAHGLLR